MQFVFPLPPDKNHCKKLNLAYELISYQSFPKAKQVLLHTILDDHAGSCRLIQKGSSQAGNSVLPRSPSEHQHGSGFNAYRDGPGLNAT